jgi:hypothetical protein
MIVRARDEGQLLITQPDHAALAARLMREWHADAFSDSPRREVILLAVERHDHGWLDLDAAPLIDDESGHILDFITSPAETKRAVWPQAVAQLDAAPYAAALVAQHAIHVYRRYRDQADWKPFFQRMEAMRDRQLLEAAPLLLEELLRDYVFVRIGDLLSLTFCNDWTDVQHDDAGSTYSIRLEGNRLLVTPDPFQGRKVPFEVPARDVRRRAFRSASEAREAFASAPTVLLRGVAAGR